MKKELTAFVEREGDGYVAICSDLDIASQGDTAAEARANLINALTLYFETASAGEIAKRLRGKVVHKDGRTTTPNQQKSHTMTDDSNNSDWPKFIPTTGSRLGGVHKDKKQRITEAMCDLQLVLAGLAMRGEGKKPIHDLIEDSQSLARAGSVFLRKLVLERRRLLDDEVLESLDMKLKPVRNIPQAARRIVELSFYLDGGEIQINRIADENHNPIIPPETRTIFAGHQGYSIHVEWPLLGAVDCTPEGDYVNWKLTSDQLFDGNSERTMTCNEWLGQQVVLLDNRGITLEKILRTVVNFEGAHSIYTGRLMTIEGETPSGAAREPHLHIVNNLTLFGVSYMQAIVIETAQYLFQHLLDEPSIANPKGDIYMAIPEFQCPSTDYAESNRPPWLQYQGNVMLAFGPNPGIVRHNIRAPTRRT